MTSSNDEQRLNRTSAHHSATLTQRISFKFSFLAMIYPPYLAQRHRRTHNSITFLTTFDCISSFEIYAATHEVRNYEKWIRRAQISVNGKHSIFAFCCRRTFERISAKKRERKAFFLSHECWLAFRRMSRQPKQQIAIVISEFLCRLWSRTKNWIKNNERASQWVTLATISIRFLSAAFNLSIKLEISEIDVETF